MKPNKIISAANKELIRNNVSYSIYIQRSLKGEEISMAKMIRKKFSLNKWNSYGKNVYEDSKLGTEK